MLCPKGENMLNNKSNAIHISYSVVNKLKARSFTQVPVCCKCLSIEMMRGASGSAGDVARSARYANGWGAV